MTRMAASLGATAGPRGEPGHWTTPVKQTAAAWLNRALGLVDAEIVGRRELSRLRLKASPPVPQYPVPPIPATAQGYLHAANPRLLELRERYRRLALPVTEHSLWTEEYVAGQVSLRAFRGDNAYIWQHQDGNDEVKYLLSTYYARAIDRSLLIPRLGEDGLFGAQVVEVGDRCMVSRDLLDSVLEIYFLDDLLGLSTRQRFNVLDVGAGYGRLAHRLVTAFPNAATVHCVDAVPESTFLSEFYLAFRGVAPRATTVPLDQLDSAFADTTIDLAVNVHSFSECKRSAVRWWLGFVRHHQIQHLMIVPNGLNNGGARLLTHEGAGRRLDFLGDVEAAGYRLIVSRPKYADPGVQKHGISPTRYYLFELAA